MVITMDIETFKTLLATHGAEVQTWPEEQQPAARILVDQDAKARLLLEQEQALGHALDRYTVEINTSALEARIMSALPERPNGILDRLLDWLIPKGGGARNLWRPALAATLPLVIGVVMGGTINVDDSGYTDNYTTADYEQELYLMALTIEETESTP